MTTEEALPITGGYSDKTLQTSATGKDIDCSSGILSVNAGVE